MQCRRRNTWPLGAPAADPLVIRALSSKYAGDLAATTQGALLKIELKLKRCKEELLRHKRYLRGPASSITDPIARFTPAKANIFILFLEATALEDKELSNVLGDQLELVRSRIMEDDSSLEDFTIIHTIRSEHLLHRDGNKVNTIIKVSDLGDFIREGMTNLDLFQHLETYVDQMIARLEGEKIDCNRKIKVSSFLKKKADIDQVVRQVATRKQIRQHFCKIFLMFTGTNSVPSLRRQNIMFEFLVNFIPLLENMCGSNIKGKKELQDLRTVRHDLLHKFHTYASEIARQFYLRKYVEKMKPTLFKFVYSQHVDDIFRGPVENVTEQMLKQAFIATSKKVYVADEFCNPSGVSTVQLIVSRLEGPKTPSESTLEDLQYFLTNYVKMMVFFDNEDEIRLRKKKQPTLPERYDSPGRQDQELPEQYDRLSDVRLFIYTCFNSLKEFNEDPEVWEDRKKDYCKDLKKCGLLKTNFQSIIDVYVEGNINDDALNVFNEFNKRILDDIVTIYRVKKAYVSILEI